MGTVNNAVRDLGGSLTAARTKRRTVGSSVLARRHARVVAGNNCTVGSSSTSPMPKTSVSAILIFFLSDMLLIFYYRTTGPLYCGTRRFTVGYDKKLNCADVSLVIRLAV